jgi:hypothetical protein
MKLLKLLIFRGWHTHSVELDGPVVEGKVEGLECADNSLAGSCPLAVALNHCRINNVYGITFRTAHIPDPDQSTPWARQQQLIDQPTAVSAPCRTPGVFSTSDWNESVVVRSVANDMAQVLPNYETRNGLAPLQAGHECVLRTCLPSAAQALKDQSKRYLQPQELMDAQTV